jgi:hypothetical protein
MKSERLQNGKASPVQSFPGVSSKQLARHGDAWGANVNFHGKPPSPQRDSKQLLMLVNSKPLPFSSFGLRFAPPFVALSVAMKFRRRNRLNLCPSIHFPLTSSALSRSCSAASACALASSAVLRRFCCALAASRAALAAAAAAFFWAVCLAFSACVNTVKKLGYVLDLFYDSCCIRKEVQSAGWWLTWPKRKPSGR